MIYTMSGKVRQDFATVGMEILTGGASEELVYSAVGETLKAYGVEDVAPEIQELIAIYHYNLAIREAMVGIMAETIEELEN